MIGSHHDGPSYTFSDLLCYILQKGPGKEVITDVSSTVDQLAVRASELSGLSLDLAVFHHLGDAPHHADHAHWLCGANLLHHLTNDTGEMPHGNWRLEIMPLCIQSR